MDLDIRGVARIFVDLASHSDLYGELAGDVVRPQSYRRDVRRNGVARRYEVASDGRATDTSPSSITGRPQPVTGRQIGGRSTN
jgi:hypothetical protein